ncbi:enoyl-ACP reductase FabV [Vibrio gallicus]|uniref:enoyl-ACP reductase FabV n=1 Tax=Vibrio gallicus TaxID=190897 RepID=UPI0021C42A8F|nr:enoyl-ACP reductase FabV [Vibrio gallicus]
MKIEPIVKGVVARSAHPLGCKQAILNQIKAVDSANDVLDQSILPKRVLVLGGSSGFGLASRIALAFGAAQADTISVSYEKGPSDKGVGTAGWYNNIYFKQSAQQAHRKAININGDAFAQDIRKQVIQAIKEEFDGQVDLIIYSLATGARPGANGELWRSAIKPIGESLTGASITFDSEQWLESTLAPATEQEIYETQKVMGGEDWANWIDELINADVIAKGAQSIAFSYIGPSSTHATYHQGTLGRAKVDLHQTSHAINLKLAPFAGSAYAVVCKALVTKASVYIPTFAPYVIALYKAMKEQGVHETPIEQMIRLFNAHLYPSPRVDQERLIRIDDLELNPRVQTRVDQILSELTKHNFKLLGDYKGFKQEFMQLNGFEIEGVDYEHEFDLEQLIALGVQ